MESGKSKFEEDLDKQTGLLNLRGKGLTDEDIEELCKFINANPEVIALDLSQNKLTAESCKLLKNALKENAAVIALNISDNTIGDEGILSLAFFKNLKILNIANTGFTGGATYELSMLNLQTLILDANEISDATFAANISPHLKNIPSLECLSVADNQLGYRSAEAIVVDLPGLIGLDIHHNQMDDDDAEEIAKMKNLSFLDARENKLTEKGKTILSNMTLTKLDPIKEASLFQLTQKKEIPSLVNLTLFAISKDPKLKEKVDTADLSEKFKPKV